MAFACSFNISEKYLLFSYEGELTDAAINEFLEEAPQQILSHQCYKLINDYRDAILNFSPARLIEVQQKVAEAMLTRGISLHLITRALVINESINNFSYSHIFETVNLNHGLNLKVFTNMDEALQWIKAQ